MGVKEDCLRVKDRTPLPSQLPEAVRVAERVAGGLQEIRAAAGDSGNEDGGTERSTTCDWRAKWRQWWRAARVK